MNTPDILVIGAGPAGLTAGLYGARSGHSTVVLERALPGGQVALTSEVENYPGFAEPIQGMALTQAMEAQARRFGCTVETGEVSGIAAETGGLVVSTTAGEYRPRTAIIASGVISKQLGLDREDALRGRGVSYCAVCDGPLFRGKEVAVVGGGDSALDETLYLAGICSRVHLIHRRDEFRGNKTAQDRLVKLPNVVFHLSAQVTALTGEKRLESIDITSRKDNAVTNLPVSGLFIYVGSVPNTTWCRGVVTLDELGFVVADNRLRTNVPGLFAAGDVRVTPLRQIATAVADGALAAMSAHDYLSGSAH
ncbi:MAG: thioredoxin-disulfide reductase [bacterium]